jgi:hypothetical protein
MNLPKIDHPTYTTEVPSTGQLIEFRPYLVKEEKIMMMAAESKDTKEMVNAIIKLIDACTFNSINVSSLKLFDIEFLFAIIRSKSVGEFADIMIKCVHCEESNEVSVPIDSVKIEYPKHYKKGDNYTKKIKLTDKIGVVLSYPKALDMIDFIEEKNQIDMMQGIMFSSLEYVYDENKIYKKSDTTSQEFLEFIDSLNEQQLKSIIDFIESMPKAYIDIKFKCKSCGKENHIKLEGINNFLS